MLSPMLCNLLHLGHPHCFTSSRLCALPLRSVVTMIRLHPLSRMPSPQPVTVTVTAKSTASTQTVSSEPASRGTQTLKGTLPSKRVDQTVGRPTVCSSNKVATRRPATPSITATKMSASKPKATKAAKTSSTLIAPRMTRSARLMREASEQKVTAREKAAPAVKRPTSLKKVPGRPSSQNSTESSQQTQSTTDRADGPPVKPAPRVQTATVATQGDSTSGGSQAESKETKTVASLQSITSPSIDTDLAQAGSDLMKPASPVLGATSPPSSSGWPGIAVGHPGRRSSSLSPGAVRQDAVSLSPDTLTQLVSLDQSSTTNPELVDSGVFEDMSPSPVYCQQTKPCPHHTVLEHTHDSQPTAATDNTSATSLYTSCQHMESNVPKEPVTALFQDKPNSDSLPQETTPKRERKKSKKRKKGGKYAVDEDGQSAKMAKRLPPNFFVAVQITDENIMDCSRKIQKHVLSQNELLTSAAVPLATLHLTLLVLRLQEPDELLRACQALEESAVAINDLIWVADKFRVHSLGNFRHGVLFAHVYPGRGKEQLQRIADTVVEVFGRHGLMPSDNKAYKPHLTLMKLSRAPNLKKKGVSRIDPEFYQHYLHQDLGQQAIQDIQLCAMLKPKQSNGYYQVEAAADIGKQKRKTFATELQKILEWKTVKG